MTRKKASDEPAKCSDRLGEISAALSTLNSTVISLGEAVSRSVTEAAGTATVLQLRSEIRELRGELDAVRADAQAGTTARTRSSTSTGAAAVPADCPQSGAAAGPVPPAAGPCGPAGGHGYHDLLDRAAGIACAELACHRDTWAFLVQQAVRGEHFHLPVGIEANGEGIIEVVISGRTLIAVVDTLWQTRHATGTPAGTRSLAAKIHERIGDALHQVDTGEDGTVIRIVIDDRKTGPRGTTDPSGAAA